MQVVILCGGMGTRLKEETEYKPKPMVEIGGKPILWHIMKHYEHYGYNEFILALGYKGDIIRNYFLNYRYYNSNFTIHLSNNTAIEFHNSSNCLNWKITFVETGSNSMTGYRTKLCSVYIKESNFMLTYGDAVSNVNIDKLIAHHKKMNRIGTVTGVSPPSRFGNLSISGNMVDKFKEKPNNSTDKDFINAGFFVFKKEFLSMLQDDPTCDLEGEPLEKLAMQKQFVVYKHYGFWQCMDTYRDFVLLNDLWKKSPEWKIWDD
ncbi:MAG: glucose-1-phosphate cytidylyltransferase [Candidatus Fischerbacteria bacterium RBG_13_37_8]|uniref:Glucose-1-phosphate cytidylyltransferase n=1 Tax=Candidatus Fischerbacteria bacterium RBG_13_37_8 TaxID=1817863 RepID=A0A1F5VP14_9BACT|nr:MAG: glucose-1-phosphate cytidylyltransferase [Candidatus Fischerbacteria bacterium RBG_13_37_8]